MKTIITIILIAIGITTQAQKLNIAAAANLKFVLDDIKTAYLAEHPKTNILITYGSSGKLSQQILNGAAFDLFMSADTDFPAKLKQRSATVGDAIIYAKGKLVMYSTTLDVTKGLALLDDPRVKKIAVANPDVATYGTRTIELFTTQNLMTRLAGKIVYGENITQTAQFAYTGNAEVGFIALSLALSPEMAAKGRYYLIDTSLYAPIEQSQVRIKTPVANPEAQRFIQYVLSPKMKPLWEKYGYSTPH